MSQGPVAVLVSGPPGSGKTTLARELAPTLGLPLIAKDDIKETIFDSMGWSDVDWSRKVGAATWEILFLLFEQLVRGGTSFVMESNFHAEHRDRLEALRERYPFESVEVHCSAEPEVLEKRFYERDRHPGHRDAEMDFVYLQGVHAPLELDAVVRVDTTDPEQVDVESIARRVREVAHDRADDR
jgi:predicted kinase